MSSVKPYNTADKTKSEEVAEMFDNISGSYDFLNRSLSMGVDISWRKKTVKQVKETGANHVLDVATGTADLAIMMVKNGIERVTGADLSAGMLKVGDKKVTEQGFDSRIKLVQADSERLPFEAETFDAATISFGIRNFEHPVKGMADIHRVLKPGSTLFILEFSKPTDFPFKQFFGFYFRFILPVWGKIISKDDSAYSYLPESIHAFPHGKAFTDLMEKAGFKNAKQQKLAFGVASLYTATK